MLSQIVTSVKGIYYNEIGEQYSILPTFIHNGYMDYPFQRVVRCKIDYGVDFINFCVGEDENGNLRYANSLYDYLSMMLIIMNISSFEEFLSKLGLTECTKEEFYDLNNI